MLISSEEEEEEDESGGDATPPRRQLKYKITRRTNRSSSSRGKKSKNSSPEPSTSKFRGRSAGRANDASKSRGSDTAKRGRSHSERRKKPMYDEETDQKASVNRRRSTGVWKSLNACQNLLSELIKHKDSWPFLLPVSKKQVPDYYDIIKNPMDFSTMQNKFKSIEYTDPVEFIADVKLVLSNCLTYNMPRSVHAKAAVQLGGYFEKRLRETGLDQYKDEENPPNKRRKS